MLEDGGGEIIPHSAWDVGRFGEDTILANLDTGLAPLSFMVSQIGCTVHRQHSFMNQS